MHAAHRGRRRVVHHRARRDVQAGPPMIHRPFEAPLSLGAPGVYMAVDRIVGICVTVFDVLLLEKAPGTCFGGKGGGALGGSQSKSGGDLTNMKQAEH